MFLLQMDFLPFRRHHLASTSPRARRAARSPPRAEIISAFFRVACREARFAKVTSGLPCVCVRTGFKLF